LPCIFIVYISTVIYEFFCSLSIPDGGNFDADDTQPLSTGVAQTIPTNKIHLSIHRTETPPVVKYLPAQTEGFNSVSIASSSLRKPLRLRNVNTAVLLCELERNATGLELTESLLPTNSVCSESQVCRQHKLNDTRVDESSSVGVDYALKGGASEPAGFVVTCNFDQTTTIVQLQSAADAAQDHYVDAEDVARTDRASCEEDKTRLSKGRRRRRRSNVRGVSREVRSLVKNHFTCSIRQPAVHTRLRLKRDVPDAKRDRTRAKTRETHRNGSGPSTDSESGECYAGIRRKFRKRFVTVKTETLDKRNCSQLVEMSSGDFQKREIDLHCTSSSSINSLTLMERSSLFNQHSSYQGNSSTVTVSLPGFDFTLPDYDWRSSNSLMCRLVDES